MTLADINLLFIFWISGFSRIVLLTIDTFPANYVMQSIFLVFNQNLIALFACFQVNKKPSYNLRKEDVHV